MNKDKVKNYIKENWVPITLVAIATIGTGTLVSRCIKACKAPVYVPFMKELAEAKQIEQLLANQPYEAAQDLPKIEFDIANVTDYWKENGFTDLIFDGIKLSDLGKFSEELIEKIPGANGDTEVNCVMGLLI